MRNDVVALFVALSTLAVGAGDFSVVDFGAQPDGTVCTKSFAAAIDAAHAAGGGCVVVPDGTWTVGSVKMKSNVELHLSDGAVLSFTDDPADYLPAVPRSTTGIECMGWSSPVYAYGCTNVALTGRGTLVPKMDYWRQLMRMPQEGGSDVAETLYFWCATNAPLAARDLTKLPPSALGRPALLHFNRCRGVRLDGVRIRQSPYWVIHFYLSDEIVVRNVDLFAYGCNNDALDVEMSSNVLVEGCTFFGGDDGICLKAGRNADGWRLGKPTENVTVRRCHVAAAHSVLACGSELSAGIRNVLVEDCTAGSVRSVLKIKTNDRRGGFVRGVTVRNVKARHADAVFGVAYDGFRWKYPDFELRDTPIEDILLENISVHNARDGIVVPPRLQLPPKNVVLRDITIDRVCGDRIRMPDATGVAVDRLVVREPGVPRTGVVFDRLEKAGRYAALSPNFAKAIAFLTRPDLYDLKPGCYAIDGSEVFANVSDVRLKPVEDSKAEIHRDYADIQMTFGRDGHGGRGSKEFIGFGPLPDGLSFPPFKPGSDTTTVKAVLPVAPICENLFMIAFPGGVHAPCLTDGAPWTERKICIKVKKDWAIPEETRAVKMLSGEHWWGVMNYYGTQMPFDAKTDLVLDVRVDNESNQAASFLVSDRGRFLWSDAQTCVTIRDGVITMAAESAPVELDESGKTLREAFLNAAAKHFPPSGKTPDLLFFSAPQYNTWIELTYHQNEKDILAYAQSMLDNGLPPGVFMIDDTWQRAYGDWNFEASRFPDPKGMMDKLHAMGYKVMLWICPFVGLDTVPFRRIAWGSNPDDVKGWPTKGGFLGPADHPAAVRWWNGYSALLDFTHPNANAWFREQLDRLMRDYGADGFKLDGGHMMFYARGYETFRKGATSGEQMAEYAKFAIEYPCCEFRNAWKFQGVPVVERLHDKAHTWEALRKLIPDMIAGGLLGHPFMCPDMVGGGAWTAFQPGAPFDPDLFVRSAQVHALCGMMQFSASPWRYLDTERQQIVRDVVKMRQEKFAAFFVDLAKECGETGEPMMRNLEYNYPGQGYATVADEFMMGTTLLVAPVVEKGATSRDVVVPPGRWRTDDGKIVEGPSRITVETPLARLPYLVRED